MCCAACPRPRAPALLTHLTCNAIHCNRASQMQKSVSNTTWRPEVMEEMEDAEGNVFDRKTYEDLAKQGLL